MKKHAAALFLAICLCSLFISCREMLEEDTMPLPPGQFWAQTTTDNSFYAVAADLLASGTYCDVYVTKDQQGSVTLSKAQAVADEFDDNIFGLVSSSFGPPSDVDGNGKIIILLLDIIDGYTGSGSYSAGYFQAMHSLTGLLYPHSNHADMIFMDTNPGIVGSSTFNMTLAHEFQHLVNFNQTY
ncbi:MAG: hypothetical protein LBT68_04060, partial [Spirochaetales bacterium]|nr:hypothetical protein [Spirochaetales bacterium]